MDNKDIPCKEHPDAPHGFMRDASHSAGRYVCECEFWEPQGVAATGCGNGLRQVRTHTPEHVARITGFYQGHCVIQPTDPALVLHVGMALYRSPKEWVGLTDEEVYQAESGCWFLDEFDKTLFARAIEAKLKEKNT